MRTHMNEAQPDPTVAAHIKSDLENMHLDIRSMFATDKPELLEISRYYFDGSGKSIRPLIVCAMARVINRQQDDERLDPAQRRVALISEMIHVASLIHDDIIDHSELRRGRASVNARWGAPKAVLAGDYILAVASRALAQLGNSRVVETLSRVLEDLVKGELMQFGTKEDENERFEHYTVKTYRKTASLIANSCKAVAILAQSQKPCVATSSTQGSHHGHQAGEPRRYPHDAPERDFVNFPPPRVPVEGGKVRIGLVPDDWFKAMYDKTGVTGPYIIFWGGLATLLSKEYLIYWADSVEQLVFLGLVVYISKTYGKTIGAWLDKEADAANAAITKDLADQTKAIEEKIVQNEALQSLPEANKIIHAAKRENLQLQLEASFRQRLHQLYQEVKRRLDYQLAIQSVYKRLEKEQAINYILSQVNSSIGANQEKEAFQSGLGQLKALSQKYAGTI